MSVLLRGITAGGEDALHDATELLVNLLGRPLEPHGVLGHLKARDGDTTSVGSLGGPVHDTLGMVDVDGLRSRGHVSPLSHKLEAKADKARCIVASDLVLGGARHDAVHMALEALPGLLVFVVRDTGILVLELRDASALLVLEILDVGKLLLVEAILVDDGSVGVREGEDLCAELDELLARELGNVAGPGEEDVLTPDYGVVVLAHLLEEVDSAISGGLWPDEGTAPLDVLTSEDPCELVPEALVLPKQVADLASADTNVASRNVGVSADVPLELGHEGLAEAHDLVVGLALGVEVGATLATAHGERGEGVLKDLLEAKELED